MIINYIILNCFLGTVNLLGLDFGFQSNHLFLTLYKQIGLLEFYKFFLYVYLVEGRSDPDSPRKG